MRATATITLTEFLLARITEEQALAERVAERTEHMPPREVGGVGNLGLVGYPFARVLAKCEADRLIVELHASTEEHPIYSEPAPHGPTCAVCVAFHADSDCEHQRFPCPTLRALALPYADHPDYREEWKP